MKLSYKIFIGICIPAMVACIVISFFLIERNVEISIENENTLLIRNLEKIENKVQFAIYNDTKLSVNENSYKNREVKIYYLRDGNVEYQTDESMLSTAKEINNLAVNKYSIQQISVEDKKYSIAATKVDESNEIIFIENIDFIYEERNEMIKNCVIIFSIMMVVIAVIAYIIAKTLTRPLEELQKEMKKVSEGNFKINLKKHSGEFGRLESDFNQMSKELEKRNSDLIELINSKQMFIDNLAHEMNTPLTSIQGYAELMQRANLDEEKRNKYLEYIQSESKRILDMYKKLLLLSYKKNSDLEIKEVSMKKVISEISKTIAEKLQSKNISLIHDIQIDHIKGDETLIIMCVLNLVKNAISVSKENSEIKIEAFARDGKKYINVIDNGKGIDKEDIEKITDPFYRVDKVRSRKDGGAGLGLSICKSIVEMHNGQLKIESVLGLGSIFMLEFPGE